MFPNNRQFDYHKWWSRLRLQAFRNILDQFKPLFEFIINNRQFIVIFRRTLHIRMHIQILKNSWYNYCISYDQRGHAKEKLVFGSNQDGTFIIYCVTIIIVRDSFQLLCLWSYYEDHYLSNICKLFMINMKHILLVYAKLTVYSRYWVNS